MILKIIKNISLKINYFALVLFIIASALFIGITIFYNTPSKWEYQTIRYSNSALQRYGEEAGEADMVNVDVNQLTSLGSQGWELVSTYLEMETSYVNFGKNEYVTGIQPNIRPQSVICIFKRKSK